jgi:hypothetical protein
LSDFAGTYGGVRRIGRFPESLKLNLTRCDHPLPDGFGRLTDIRVGRQFAEIHQWNFHVQIDAIQERPANTLAVVFDLPEGAAALACRNSPRISPVTGRAWASC